MFRYYSIRSPIQHSLCLLAIQYGRLALLGFGFFVLMAKACSAEEPSTAAGNAPPEKLRPQNPVHDWIARQRAVKSLKVAFTGVTRIAKDSNRDPIGRPIPNRDLELPSAGTLYIDLEHGRIRCDSGMYIVPAADDEGPPKFESSVLVFDGHATRLYRPPELNKDHPVISLAERGSGPAANLLIPVNFLPVYWSLGIFLTTQLQAPHFQQDLSLAGIETIVDGAKGSQLPKSRGTASVAVQTIAQLRRVDPVTRMRHTWFVDLSMASAVIEWRSEDPQLPKSVGGRTIHVSKASHFPFGWFPTEWTLLLGASPHVSEQDTYNVSSIEANLSWKDELFAVPHDFLSPGMLVATEHRLRKVAPDGRSLVPLDAITQPPARPLWRDRVAIIVAVNILLACVIGSLWWIRRRTLGAGND